jgi:cation diffusion facilitator family transporter
MHLEVTDVHAMDPGPRVEAETSESKIAVVAALVGNGALTLLKGISAAATGSAAMLAETFHSAADTGNEALLLLGMRAARRPPDEQHPFGHGKNVYFWAFVVSVVLFAIGGAFSVWEGVRKLLHGDEHAVSAWAYAILAGAFVFEAISLSVAVRSLRRVQAGRSLREFWHETRDPTLLTVLLEDTAALVAVGVATGGLMLAQATGWPQWDAIASVVIGVILLAVAVVLALENHSLLIGERAQEKVERVIREAVTHDDAVVSIDRIRTMHVGPHEIIAMLTVRFRDDLTATALVNAIGRLHSRIETALAQDVRPRFVAIEPAGLNPRRSPRAVPEVV